MKALAVLGGTVLVVIAIVLSAVFNGYALSVLWGWFVVPTFNLPQLSIAAAIGIAMVVGYLTKQEITDPKDEDRSFTEKMVRATIFAIVKPGFALLFGWVVHLFM
jgi:hypothetical protein